MPLPLRNASPSTADTTISPTEDTQDKLNNAVNGDVIDLGKGTFTPTSTILKTFAQINRAPYGGQDNTFSVNATTGREGQLFDVGSSNISLKKVLIGMRTFGTITSNPTVVCDIFATSGNQPTGAALATSVGVNLSALPANFPTDIRDRTAFVFTTPVVLTASTRYAFVFRLTAADTGGAFFSGQLAQPQTLIAGFGRVRSTNSGSTWTNQGDEFASFSLEVEVSGFIFNKRVVITGKGHDTVLNGSIELQTGSKHSLLRGFRVNGDVVVRDDEIHMSQVWQANGFAVDDRGEDNDLRVLQEN